MPDLDCRVAKIEQRVDVNDEYLADLHVKIDKVLEYQLRQRGFIAGIVFTVGALASALTWVLGGKFHWGG